MERWTAEIVIDAAQAERLIADQFPKLEPVTARVLGVGWDNTAFAVNERFVFRFPRRAVAVPLLETENRVLPEIAPFLPLPIPCPRFSGVPAGDFPWPFSGYERLAGRTLCAAHPTPEERAALAVPLAGFLATLHALDADAPGDTIRRLDLSYRIPRAREILDSLAALGAIDRHERLVAILDHAPLEWTPRADTLVHGDLYVRHVLLGDDRKAGGVIDWGDLHRGDHALDLAIAHTVLPASSHAAFRDAYGPIADDTWAVARLRALWHTLTILEYARSTGDADLLREAHWTLGTLAESA